MQANRTPNQDSLFQIANADDAGAKFTDATAGAWELFDERGNSIATGTVTPFDNTADTFDFTILAADIQLDGDATSTGREIVLTLTDPVNGDHELRDYFLIVGARALTVMVNSFVSYAEALAVRSEFLDMAGWDAATKERREAALAEAYRKIAMMAFKVPGHTADQTKVNYARYGTGMDVPWMEAHRLILSKLTVEEFDETPAKFRAAVKRAQLAEANQMLSPNVIASKRMLGIISETVGESSAFFSSKPYLNLPVSKSAYEELKRYIHFSMKTHRG